MHGTGITGISNGGAWQGYDTERKRIDVTRNSTAMLR